MGLASSMKIAHVVLVAACVMDCFIQIRCYNAQAVKLIDLSDSSNNSNGFNQNHIEGVCGVSAIRQMGPMGSVVKQRHVAFYQNFSATKLSNSVAAKQTVNKKSVIQSQEIAR